MYITSRRRTILTAPVVGSPPRRSQSPLLYRRHARPLLLPALRRRGDRDDRPGDSRSRRPGFAPVPPRRPDPGEGPVSFDAVAVGRRVLATEAEAIGVMADELGEAFVRAVEILFACKG